MATTSPTSGHDRRRTGGRHGRDRRRAHHRALHRGGRRRSAAPRTSPSARSIPPIPTRRRTSTRSPATSSSSLEQLELAEDSQPITKFLNDLGAVVDALQRQGAGGEDVTSPPDAAQLEIDTAEVEARAAGEDAGFCRLRTVPRRGRGAHRRRRRRRRRRRNHRHRRRSRSDGHHRHAARGRRHHDASRRRRHHHAARGRRRRRNHPLSGQLSPGAVEARVRAARLDQLVVRPLPRRSVRAPAPRSSPRA